MGIKRRENSWWRRTWALSGVSSSGFTAGEQTYTITLKKLVAVTPHGNSEAESTIEQIKSNDDDKTGNKKEIFAAFKGYFK